MTKKKELKVWVSNDLTHAMFKEPGTLYEMRFAQILCALVDPAAPDFKDYSLIINPKWFATLFNVKIQNIKKDFYAIADRLGKRIMIPADNPKLVLKWYGSMRLMPDDSIKVTYSPDLHPYLCSVKKYFTAFNILDTEDLSSFYSVRLHWILSSWVNLKEVQEGQAVYQDIVELRKKMGCLDKYKQASDFIKRAVEEPVKDINANAKDISVTYKLKKSEDGKGRIQGVYFLPARKKELIKAKDIGIGLIEAMKEIGCTSAEIAGFAEKYPEDVIANRVDYYLNYKKPIKKTKLAFFRWVMGHPIEVRFEIDNEVIKERERKKKIKKEIEERSRVNQEKEQEESKAKEYFKWLKENDQMDEAIKIFMDTDAWTALDKIMKLKRKRIDSMLDLKKEIIKESGMVYVAFISYLNNSIKT